MMMTDTPATGSLDLHDIVLPEPVSWMPQTAGWWVLLSVVVVAFGWVTWKAVRRRRANRYRRLALTRLEQIEQRLSDPSSKVAGLSELPVLVKQTALAFLPRSEIAALSGDEWLNFLDRTYGGTGFTKGPGRLLPTLAYATPATTAQGGSEELSSLVDLVRRWIGEHRVRV